MCTNKLPFGSDGVIGCGIDNGSWGGFYSGYSSGKSCKALFMKHYLWFAHMYSAWIISQPLNYYRDEVT